MVFMIQFTADKMSSDQLCLLSDYTLTSMEAESSTSGSLNKFLASCVQVGKHILIRLP